MRLNVYRINDKIGFYHTGLVFENVEYTFCQTSGISSHEPKNVAFADFLGTVTLGKTLIGVEKFKKLLKGNDVENMYILSYVSKKVIKFRCFKVVCPKGGRRLGGFNPKSLKVLIFSLFWSTG